MKPMRAMGSVAVAAALGAALLAGCAERPQLAGPGGVGSGGRADTKPWDAARGPHSVGQYAQGDRAAWEKSLRDRAATTQNEYTRSR